MRRVRSIYAEHYVKRSHRARYTPRVARPWRPRVIAWAGPTAFMRDRWYQRDQWYKARIAKPEIVPNLHIIDPDRITQSYEQRTIRQRAREINIGFAKRTSAITGERDEADLEKKARKRTLEIDLSLLSSFDKLSIFDHFNVFDDLFVPGVYFHETQNFDVSFGDTGIHHGNLITAGITSSLPEVKIEALGGSSTGYNTIVMVNVDGDAWTPDEEVGDVDKTQVVHWVVANIPDGGDVSDGSTLVDYVQATPFKGTGFHRVAFVLFRHSGLLDEKIYDVKQGSTIPDRVFRMNRFFKANEDVITPTAIRFAQVRWDESVDQTLHGQGLKSPRFRYDWNPPLKPEQKEFPIKPMPFNLYLDMYRPPELVRRDMFKERLERIVHDGACEPAPYPDIFYNEHRRSLPYWQHDELIAKNTGQGKYAALYLGADGLYKNAVEQAQVNCAGSEEEKPKMSVGSV